MRCALVMLVLMLSGCTELAPHAARQAESHQAVQQPDRNKAGPSQTASGKGAADAVYTADLSKAARDDSQAVVSADADTSLSLRLAAFAMTFALGWALAKFSTCKARPSAEGVASKEEALGREIEALTKLVAVKTRESEGLAAKLKDRRDLKILQRVAQFQHALDFNRQLMASGKLDAAAAVKEIEAELEAALDELGIAPFPIEVGAKVRELPEGSFELIDSSSPPAPALAGTVSKVRQRALTYKDSAGQAHFLIPAKIDAYKL